MSRDENLTDRSVGQEMSRRLMKREEEELASVKESACETDDTCGQGVAVINVKCMHMYHSESVYLCMCM